MAIKPITFSAPMVRALLAGTKTQTRRLIAQPPEGCSIHYMLGAESWLPPEKQTPLRHLWEAWRGPLFDAKPKKALAGQFTVKMRYAPGDQVYVREHWSSHPAFDGIPPRDLKRGSMIYTRADGAWHNEGDWIGAPYGKHRQAMHMPRWASRMWLEVTDVRVQRLQDISEADAIAEGISLYTDGWHFEPNTEPFVRLVGASAIGMYQWLWNSLHTEPCTRWEDNPWVVAYSFNVHRGNVDG